MFYLDNSGTINLFLHVVKCWHLCALEDKKPGTTCDDLMFHGEVFLLFLSWVFLIKTIRKGIIFTSDSSKKYHNSLKLSL